MSKTEVTQEQEPPKEEDIKTEKLLNKVKKNHYLEASFLHLQAHREKMLQMKQFKSKSCKGDLAAMSSPQLPNSSLQSADVKRFVCGAINLDYEMIGQNHKKLHSICILIEHMENLRNSNDIGPLSILELIVKWNFTRSKASNTLDLNFLKKSC